MCLRGLHQSRRSYTKIPVVKPLLPEPVQPVELRALPVSLKNVTVPLLALNVAAHRLSRPLSVHTPDAVALALVWMGAGSPVNVRVLALLVPVQLPPPSTNMTTVLPVFRYFMVQEPEPTPVRVAVNVPVVVAPPATDTLLMYRPVALIVPLPWAPPVAPLVNAPPVSRVITTVLLS